MQKDQVANKKWTLLDQHNNIATSLTWTLNNQKISRVERHYKIRRKEEAA